MTSENWRVLALCAQVDGDLWFPERGGSVAEAKRICGLCDVRQECLEWAVSNGERFGIFGGLTERERRKLKPPPSQPPMEDVVGQVRRLARARLNDRQIGEQVNMTSGAVTKLRHRHGIPAGQPQPGHGQLVDRVRAVA